MTALRWTALLASAVAAAALAAGCGEDEAASLEEFRTQSNRVCLDVERQLERIQRAQPITADQAAEQVEAMVDVSDQALGNLRKIEPPDGFEADYDRYLTEREEAIGLLEDARDAAEDSDTRAYVAAKRRLAQGQPVRRELALRMGLRRCSRPSR